MGCMSVGILLLFTKTKYGKCRKYLKSEYLDMPLKTEQRFRRTVFKIYEKSLKVYQGTV